MDVDVNEDIGAPAERPLAGPSTLKPSKSGSVARANVSEKLLSLKDAHEMRITRGGQIKHFVQFALKFLEEHPDRPLTLHTLPAPPSARTHQNPPPSKKRKRIEPPEASSSTSNTSDVISIEPTESVETNQDPEPEPGANGTFKTHHRSAASVASTTIPRLISVVEIIKREYLKSRPKARVKLGLWQYNEIGWLEESGSCVTGEDDDEGGGGGSRDRGGDAAADGERKEEERAKMIIETLEGGKKHLPIRRAPYLKITLCARELDKASISRRMTTQQPAFLKMSKSARARDVRRKKKENALACADKVIGEVEGSTVAAPAKQKQTEPTTAKNGDSIGSDEITPDKMS